MTQNLPSKQNGALAVAGQAKPTPLSDIIRTKIGNVLTGKKADDFVTAVISLTNQDPKLKECDNLSLISAALQAQSLNLALHKSLGQAFIVPYEDKKNKVQDQRTGQMVPRLMAAFQLGYKGYIQLAIRSGYYRKINVLAIKEGELKRYDPLTEDIEVELIDDAVDREDAPTVGYYCMFEYLNGFRKTMYWSKKKMEAHANMYSPAFSLKATNGKYSKVSFADYEAGKVRDSDKWLYSSFWYKDFDAMALKTMLRQILSKWGIMSVELQTAYDADYRVMSEDDDQSWADDVSTPPGPTTDDLNKALDPDFDEVVDGEVADPAPNTEAADENDDISPATLQAVEKELSHLGTPNRLPPDIVAEYDTGDPSELTEAQGKQALVYLKGMK